jgi:hypothetical protein
VHLEHERHFASTKSRCRNAKFENGHEVTRLDHSTPRGVERAGTGEGRCAREVHAHEVRLPWGNRGVRLVD